VFPHEPLVDPVERFPGREWLGEDGRVGHEAHEPENPNTTADGMATGRGPVIASSHHPRARAWCGAASL